MKPKSKITSILRVLDLEEKTLGKKNPNEHNENEHQ